MTKNLHLLSVASICLLAGSACFGRGLHPTWDCAAVRGGPGPPSSPGRGGVLPRRGPHTAVWLHHRPCVLQLETTGLSDREGSEWELSPPHLPKLPPFCRDGSQRENGDGEERTDAPYALALSFSLSLSFDGAPMDLPSWLFSHVNSPWGETFVGLCGCKLILCRALFFFFGQFVCLQRLFNTSMNNLYILISFVIPSFFLIIRVLVALCRLQTSSLPKMISHRVK